MNFLIRKDFFSKIPNEKIDEVQKDLKLFSRELIINNFIITKLKKGWKVDKITGTDGLLEFRVNQGDRIIFELTADNLVFWNWGKHDYAITTGKNINRDKDLLENFSIEINHKALLIDEIFLTEKLYDLEEIELSNEQIEVLHIKENLPCIVNGVPGSGKTLLIDHLLNSINSEALVLYISYNKKPIEKKNVRKITFEELFDIPRKIIGFDDFYEWFKQIKNSSFRPEDALDIWFYINNPNEKRDKEVENFITGIYNNWLIKEKKIDLIEYTRLALNIITNSSDSYKYDLVLCDDIQEISSEGIKLLQGLLNNDKCFIGFGDSNSSLKFNGEFFNLHNDFSFNIKELSNNYRSNSIVVNFLKELSNRKIEKKSENDVASSINGIVYYKDIDKVINDISNSETILSLGRSFINSQIQIKEKISDLKDIVDKEFETIICLDFLHTLQKIVKSKNENLFNKYLYFVSGKSKANIIFLEDESKKKEVENIIKLPVYDWELIQKIIVYKDKKLDMQEVLILENEERFEKAIHIYKYWNMQEGEDIAKGNLLIKEQKYHEALLIFEKYEILDKVEYCQDMISIKSSRDRFSYERNIDEYIENLQKTKRIGRLELAKTYYNLGKTDTCFSILVELVDFDEFEGEIEFLLGVMHLKGYGTKQNKEQGVELLKKSLIKEYEKAGKLLKQLNLL